MSGSGGVEECASLANPSKAICCNRFSIAFYSSGFSWRHNSPSLEGRTGESQGIDPVSNDNEIGVTADESQEKLQASTVDREIEAGQKETSIMRRLASWRRNYFKCKKWTHWVLLFLSCAAMMIALPASSILTRLYFINGGGSKWILSWLPPAGWPITVALLVAFCVIEREYPSSLTWGLTLAYAVLGLLSAADNLMFAWAYAYLPVSTATVVASTSLPFTAIFAYFIVGQKFNYAIFDSIGIMTASAVILGLDSNSDRQFGVSSSQYLVGFLLDIGASALHGLIFALSELLFIKLLGRKSFRVVLESQAAISLFTMIFTTIGTLVAGDFGKIHEEAGRFKGGPSAYYQVVVWGIVSFQLGILGSVGCLYLANALLAGVLNAGRVPATAIVAVVCFNDPMGGFKILSIILTMWSFGAYTWGSITLRSRNTVQTILPGNPG